MNSTYAFFFPPFLPFEILLFLLQIRHNLSQMRTNKKIYRHINAHVSILREIDREKEGDVPDGHVVRGKVARSQVREQEAMTTRDELEHKP